MKVIYRATNKINGKSYIGFDSKWPNRKNEHNKRALSGKGEYFHNALRKYGTDNFDWEVLLENATLNDEIRLIEEYSTYENGYNLTRGGEGKLGYITPEETKRKISSSQKGKKVSAEQLEVLRKNSEKMKETGHTEETKKKISEAFKGIPKSEKHRKSLSENHAARKETGTFYKSQEYKDKMSMSLKGKTRTPEQRERYRQAALNRKKRTSNG